MGDIGLFYGGQDREYHVTRNKKTMIPVVIRCIRGRRSCGMYA